MTRHLIVRVILVLWALVARAGAQTDLSVCYGNLRVCGDPVLLTFGICPTGPSTPFAVFVGHVAWYPLQCVGPITVAIETASLPGTRFPIYIEVVPLEGMGDYRVCESAGPVVAMVYGHNYDPCGTWDEIGPIDITTAVPIGTYYALRLYFPGDFRGFAPAWHCLRVTAHPVERTPVVPTTWGLVKSLYK